MEEGTRANPKEVRVKLLDTKIEELKNEDDEETALENEFIKVEKESIDVKENFEVGMSTTVVEELSCSPEVKTSNNEPNSELLEAHEKIKQLETELGTLSQELQYAESEKSRFQAEVSVTNEKLQQSDKQCKELEIDVRRLKEEMVEAGLKNQSQLESLQEALAGQEAKHKELLNVKEVFDVLSLELESSRKRAEKLELDLLSSADELRRFEELSNERGLHADSESKKALELEKMLEIAKLNAKEMEKQTGLVQEELKDLYDKVTKSQHAEEALSKTRFDLSVLHEELELSKVQVAELSQKVVSEEAVIQELTQELNLHKASEGQLREDILAMETTLSTSKEDLQTKDANIKEHELKLQENLEEKGKIEANLKIQELQALNLQEELLRSSKEKETLEMTIGELDAYLLQSKERCSELENKLNLSEEKFIKTDILLLETLSLNAELQQNLKSLEELQKESGAVAEILSQKNIEFEDMLKASNAALDDVKTQLRETEGRLISVEQTNIELEQQLNLAELKCGDSDREIKELHDNVLELSNLLKASEEEHALSKCHFQAYQDRLSQLESSFEKSSLRKVELEKELAEKCAEHESHSTAARNRSLELEEFIQVAHSQVENSGNRVSELELLLETTNHRILELEEQLNIKKLKHKDTEAELEQKNNQFSELSAELEAFQVKSSSLEIALAAANNKERELTDLLNAVSEEKKVFEDLSKNTGEKLFEAENHVNALQTELNLSKEKMQDVVSDLEASGIREREILEQLKSAQEQLEHKGRLVENATARSLDLESLHDSLSKELELKLQEATRSFTEKDSEVKQLQEKLKSFEEQAAHYQIQETEATNRLALLEIELKESANRLVTLEGIINELNAKLLDAEKRSEQYLSENELLAETNMKLKAELEAFQVKLSSLEVALDAANNRERNLADLLDSVTEEKNFFEDLSKNSGDKLLEAENHADVLQTELDLTKEKLQNVVSDLESSGLREREILEQLKYAQEQLEHQGRAVETATSRSLKLESLHDSLSKESELKLQEAIVSFTQKDSEAKQLHEKLNLFEEQAVQYQNQATEATNRLALLEIELKESANRLVSLESIINELNAKLLDAEKRSEQSFSENELLAETNMKLKAELEAFQGKLSSLEVALDAANNSEREFTDLLDAVTEEKKIFEDLSKNSGEKLLEAENLVDVLQTDLNFTKEKLQNVVGDLEASGLREREILEQLKYAQEQLEHQGRAVETATARSLKFESLHDSVSKESELRLQEAIVSVTQKDSEAKQLHEKLNLFEEQAAQYQNKATEATNRLALLEIELKESANRLVSLESIINELNAKLLDAEKRSEQSFSDNELLVETNMKLKAELEAHQHKINDLHGSLSSFHAEKDVTAEQLAFHVQTISELRGQHTKALELHSETEFCKKETEAQLTEALERLTQKDSEARGLRDRINDLEGRVSSYEERLREAAVAAEVQTAELDESLSKLRILDGMVEETKSKISQLESENEYLTETNMKLTQELATNLTQMNDLQTTINTSLSEKENACVELHSLSKANEALTQKLTSEGEILQSQISSLVEEKNLVDKKHQETRKETQAVITQMEEQINEYRAKEHSLSKQVESFIDELKVKSEMQEQIAELKQKLLSSETQITEEIESIKVASAEKEAALISKLEEHASKLKDKDIVCEQLEQLQKELNLAHTTISEQREVDSRKGLEREAAMKQLIDEMEAKHQRAIALEKQVEELKQELHQSEVQSTENDKEETKRLKAELDELRIKLSRSVEEIAELENKLQLAYKSEQYKGDNAGSKAEDEVHVKSRDFDFSTLKGQASHTSTAAIAANPEAATTTTTTTEPTGLMALKFILGVALVSMILGVILGKRY